MSSALRASARSLGFLMGYAYYSRTLLFFFAKNKVCLSPARLYVLANLATHQTFLSRRHQLNLDFFYSNYVMRYNEVCPRNDLESVEWDIKPLLTHSRYNEVRYTKNSLNSPLAIARAEDR